MRSNVDVEREWLHLISGVIAGAGILFTSFFFFFFFFGFYNTGFVGVALAIREPTF